MNDDTFYALSLAERVDAVNEKIGGIHPDRVSTVQELIDLYGKTVYIVLSPYGQEQDIGNGFIHEWVVGRITTPAPDKTPIDVFDESMVDTTKFVCEYLSDDPNAEYRATAIKDFNVIPNNHNNHCMFSSLEGVEAYVLYRKLKWDEDENLIEIKSEYDFWITDDSV